MQFFIGTRDMMQNAILILVVAWAAGGKASFLSRRELEPGISVKFSIGLSPGKDFFYLVPMNITQAQIEKWIKTVQPDDVPECYKELEMYCFECEGPICALYELYSGYIAGLQIMIEKNKLSGTKYDMIKNGFTEWTWTCGGVSRTHYIIRQYYMKQFLSKSPSKRKSSCNTSKVMQDDIVLTQGPGGVLLQSPANGTKLRTESDFTQQACIYWMGTHYYYKMSKTTECSATGIYPWFMLMHGDNNEKQTLIGCCMMCFGKMSAISGSRDWFEQPNTMAVKKIVNNGPQCLYDYADGGVITMHVYFVKHPNLIYC